MMPLVLLLRRGWAGLGVPRHLEVGAREVGTGCHCLFSLEPCCILDEDVLILVFVFSHLAKVLYRIILDESPSPVSIFPLSYLEMPAQVLPQRIRNLFNNDLGRAVVQRVALRRRTTPTTSARPSATSIKAAAATAAAAVALRNDAQRSSLVVFR